MKRILVPQLPREGHPVEIPLEEARHLLQVLRLRGGETIELMDGRGGSALAILRAQGKRAWAELTQRSATAPARVWPLILELGILKGEAMEWAVEKAVELGVRTLVPVIAAHSVVQTGRKGPETFRDRWQRIADQALKQCGRLTALEVLLPTPLPQLLAQQPSDDSCPRLWCDEASRDSGPELLPWLLDRPALRGLRILIGPEGGWSAAEREMLGVPTPRAALPISLGPWVLRAETAAILSCGIAAAALRRASLDKGPQEGGSS